MLEIISTLLAGAALGFASSSPLGVINLWVADVALARTERRLFWFLTGVIACDVTFAALAAWGYHAFFEGRIVADWLRLVGGLLLLFLGWRQSVMLSVARVPAKPHKMTNLSDLALGATLCGSNPAFLMFWIVAVSVLDEQLGIPAASLNVGALIIGVLIGDILWFWLLTRIVHRSRDVITSVTLARIRRTIGWLFVGVGAVIAVLAARDLLPR